MGIGMWRGRGMGMGKGHPFMVCRLHSVQASSSPLPQ